MAYCVDPDQTAPFAYAILPDTLWYEILRHLLYLFSGDKVEMKRKREEALQKVEERLKEESTKKDENKRANEKFALKEIMKVCVQN